MTRVNEHTWLCLNCNEKFDEPRVIRGHGDYVKMDSDSPDEYECPYCGSDDFVMAGWCSYCECVTPDDDLTYGLCADCIDALSKKRAHEYIADDPNARDDFAWWIHSRLHD